MTAARHPHKVLVMKYVFLTVCSDFALAQVVKSYLVSQGFAPKVRDEQTRSIAPHFGQLLGKLTMEIPEDQFLAASTALEELENANSVSLAPTPLQQEEDQRAEVQSLAQKALLNSILGCSLLPLICTFISIFQGLKVLKLERPLSRSSRKRILWSLFFNTVAFYIWLAIGPQYFWKHF